MTDTSLMIEPLLVLVGAILVPALIFVGGFTYLRMKRSSFRHQRSPRHAVHRRSH